VATHPESSLNSADLSPKIPRTAYFALFLLVLTNLFNMLDRSIVSILAQSIKTDLKLDDADLGFLLGTAFAVFYSVVGIAMGRISDFVSRKKMLAVGLALWSVMTALGGAAVGFVSLSAARIGVGVGEAVANPCSHSLLADAFPARNRALALGTYLTGTFLGTATAMIVGGLFVQKWPSFCSSIPIGGACNLAGWQAALIAVGTPGLLLALLILTLHEPPRPQTLQQKHYGTVRLVLREMATAFPPFTLFSIYGIGGMQGLKRNLMLIVLITAIAVGLIVLTGDKAQWIACSLGAYSIVTWGQVQSYGDKPLYRLTYGDPTFMLGVLATAMVACVIAGISVWAAPLAMRTFTDVSAVTIGVGMGVIYVIGAIIGVVLGGWLTDRWKTKDLAAPLNMTSIALIGLIPCIALIVWAPSLQIFLVAYFLLSIFASLWSGGIAAMIQDLVLPRMRGAAAASNALVAIVVASGIGPYWTGKVSNMTGSLGTGILSILLLAPIAFILLVIAGRKLRHETPERRLAIANEAGEQEGWKAKAAN
jgi:MFS family permease